MDLARLPQLARDLVRPVGWRGATPDPDALSGAVVFPKDRRVRSFDGTDIAYTVLGDAGPWVVTVSGFVCTDSYWKYIAPDLAKDHRVIVWDLRGLGMSGTPKPPGYRAHNLREEDFTIPVLVKDLGAVLDDAGADRATLIGHSVGGQTILETYHQMPERVSGLVFVTAPFESPMRTFYGRDVTDVYRVVDGAVRLLPRLTVVAWRALMLTDPQLPHMFARLSRALGPGAGLEDMEPYYRHMGLLDPLVMSKMARGMRDHSAADVLPTVKVPTLLLAGDLDTFTPLGIAERMHERIEGSELHILQGAGHAGIIEKADEVDAEIRAFLKRHEL